MTRHTPLRTLFVEDNEDDALLIQDTLRAGGYELLCLRVETEAALRIALRDGQWDLILSDYSLPSLDARRALEIIQRSRVELPVIVISGTVGEDVAVETLKLGAYDYLLKQNLTRLVPAVARALDVAESQRQQRKLEGLRTIIFQNSLDLLYTLDTRGRFLEVSAAATPMLGYTSAELAGAHFEILVHPDDLALVQDAVRAVLQGQRIRDVECRLITKGGRAVYVTWSGVLSPADGVIVGVAHDVTERRQKDAALRRSEESTRRERALLRALIDNMPDLVFFKDRNFVFLGCNRAFAEYYGLQEGDLIGRTDFDVARQDWAWQFRDQDQRLFETGEAQRFEAEIPGAAGRRVIFDTIKTPFFGPNGELLGLLGISRDITGRKRMEEDLREERDFSNAVLNALPGVFYHYDEAMTRLVRWNRNLEIITGYDPAELVDMDPLHFFPEEDRPKVAREIERVLTAGESRIEADNLTKDGRRIPYLFTGVRFEYGGRRGFVGIGIDISERKRVERALREETTMFEALAETGPDGVLVVDSEGRKVVQNRRLLEMLHVPPELAANPLDARLREHFVAQAKDPQQVATRAAQVFAQPSRVDRDIIELTDGRTLECYTAPIVDADAHYYGRVVSFRDITELRSAERQLLHMATHDELTGLPNRNLIRDRINAAIVESRQTGQPFGLVYLDLDRFKVINDGYGHPFGDLVLKAVGERLASLVRTEDMLSRHGGDEFLILMPGLTGADEICTVADRVVASFDRPVLVEDREIYVTGSVGVAMFPRDGADAEALIGNADLAMYRAKGLGRNTWQSFTREMGAETLLRTELETRLRGAATAGELALLYQPKVSLADGAITGCEVLLRWRHPELGEIGPDRFIPLAEESGLIVRLGQWVLREACAQAKAWLDAGLPPISVAVNLSARQFLQQDVARWVTDTLRNSGLPPAQLELELTESLLAQDIDKVTDTVMRLREAGIKLSIDDFGTGYSSLSYLRRFRVDTLKIDQSFVHDMLAEGGDRAIVLAIIQLAHNLNFRVIAEGVASEQQCRFLQQHGCDEIQGYYFSRPVPAAEFAAMLRAGKRLATLA